MQHALQGRVLGQQCSGRPGPRPAASRRQMTVRATHCPYRTLGVSQNADEQQIKQAYRRLALQYHPDVNHAMDAQRTFLSIQQAYELLTGRNKSTARGPNSANQANNWEFHDWYWSFAQKRRWRPQRGGQATAEASADSAEAAGGFTPNFKQQEHQSTLRTQLAGLRHRAAIRSTKQQRQAAAAESAAEGAAQSSESPQPPQQHSAAAAQPEAASLEYDTAEMSDGVNIGARAADPWAQAPPAGRPKFNATDRHREQVMGQMAGLKRRTNQRKEAW